MVRHEPWSGNGGEVYERIDTVVPIVDLGESLERFAEVLQIRAHRNKRFVRLFGLPACEPRGQVRWQHSIDIHDVVPVVDELAHAGTPELAASASDNNSTHPSVAPMTTCSTHGI